MNEHRRGGEFRAARVLGDRQARRSSVCRRLLDCIQVEVTSRCPGRCTYCPHTTRREQWLARDMDMGTFEPALAADAPSRPGAPAGLGRAAAQPGLLRHGGTGPQGRLCQCPPPPAACAWTRRWRPESCESGIDIVAFSLAGTDAASNAARHGVDFDRVCDGHRPACRACAARAHGRAPGNPFRLPDAGLQHRGRARPARARCSGWACTPRSSQHAGLHRRARLGSRGVPAP
ncbi:MAG: hypothetical protein MZV70_20355 [Desulfobacterales bacterium]|nr:hypothetical protein [Desulfobacterales bacterium]